MFIPFKLVEIVFIICMIFTIVYYPLLMKSKGAKPYWSAIIVTTAELLCYVGIHFPKTTITFQILFVALLLLAGVFMIPICLFFNCKKTLKEELRLIKCGEIKVDFRYILAVWIPQIVVMVVAAYCIAFIVGIVLTGLIVSDFSGLFLSA